MSLRFWTDLADGAVAFPLGLAVAALLFLLGNHRATRAWLTAVGGVWAVMLVLKFLGYMLDALAPDTPIGAVGLVSPSGHVASATVIYGGLVGLLLPRPSTMMIRTTAAAAAIAVWIGITRVLLGEHTVAEAVVGGLVGFAGALALARLAGGPLDGRTAVPIAAVAGLVMAVRHGIHLTWEDSIRQIALQAVNEWRGVG